MIPRSSVRAFIKRPRRDLRRYKDLPDVDCLAKLLPIPPPIWSKLKRHQKVMVYLGAKLGHMACLADTGSGKTLTSIALIKYFEQLGKVRSALVLVPNKINKPEWLLEIEKHAPTISRTTLTGTSAQKWGQFEDGPVLITIETYGGLVRMLSTKTLVKKKNSKQEVPKLVLNKPLIDKLMTRYDALILDESTMCQDHTTLSYRICRQLAKQSKLVLALTGTPFGRNPEALWSQMYLIDQGHALGETLGLYRAALFKEQVDYWSGYLKYEFDQKKAPLLNRMIAHSGIRYEADEADLPQAVEIQKYISLPTDAETYYERAKESLIQAKGSFIETKNAFVRMRQISSGFVGYTDDETGDKAKLVFPQNPKLEQLMSLIQEIHTNHKVVVFFDFIFSGDTICKALDEAKIGYVSLYGRKSKSEQQLLDLRRRFDTDDKVRVFALNSSGAYGLNLQKAKYAIFYESPVPVILRTQERRRVERQGSTHDKVFIIDLIVRGTIDEKIISWHKEGKDLFQAIVNGEERQL